MVTVSPLHPCRLSGAAFNQPHIKKGWISFSFNDFKSSVCRFLRIMCVFISLHSYCRAGLWSKFNDVLFFCPYAFLTLFLLDYFTVYICMCRFLSPQIVLPVCCDRPGSGGSQPNICLVKYMYIYIMYIYVRSELTAL